MASFWKCRRGFTAIEVIAVLILLGVIAAVVVARLSGTSGYTVQSTAEVLKNHLRYAQIRAMNSNVIWGVYFISTTQYAVYRNGNTNSSNWVSPPGADSDRVDLGSQGVTLGGITAGDVVSFDDWGRPCTDASGATLQNTARSITATGGGQTATIQVTQNTGYIP